MKLKDNKKLVVILIFLVILLVLGGTFAAWTWISNNSERTMVSVTLPGATLTIEGDNVTHTGMYPTAYCDGEAALIGEVATATGVNATNVDVMAVIKIRASLTVSHSSLTTAAKEKLNWAIVDTSAGTTCETTQYRGTMASVSKNTDIDTGISFVVPAGETVSRNYRIYVWLDSTYEFRNHGNNITNPMDELNISVKFSPNSELVQLSGEPEVPVLDDGMIPVKISADGVVTTVSNTDTTWYNYENKEWANVVLVKNSGTQTRSYYKSNVGVTVAEDDILAYYVWIPRYKYRIWTLTESSTGSEQTIDIVFEGVDDVVSHGSKVGDYITHPAFVWDGNTVAGLWVGKFETSHSTLSGSTTVNNLGCSNENCSNADGLIVKPNVEALKMNNTSNQFYASRSMSRSGNPFGLGSSTTDSHMMKNSEWGAVAYLSHSIYGINSEIYVNNSSYFYTGRSGGNVGGNVNTIATQFPESGSTETKIYIEGGYYTWTGQEIGYDGTIGDYALDRTLGTNASTTGNVTGIYDMSGGTFEYVMAIYNDGVINDDSGFITYPNDKYYDKYSTISSLTACDGSCFGHALSETYEWYSDSSSFVDADSPWFVRGGGFLGAATNGIFAASGFRGEDTLAMNAFRSVLILYNG